MMDCLIVWSAIGPILAFIAGAVVVAWWDDDEDEGLVPKDRQTRIRGAVPGMPGQVVSFASRRPEEERRPRAEDFGRSPDSALPRAPAVSP